MRSLSVIAACFIATLAVASPALADSPSAFERPFAIATYGAVRGGDYLAGGVGGRLRWEPLSWLGIEVYLEATHVEWPGALRHDYPNGFNLYVPIRAGNFRVRPFFGFCDVLSFVEPSAQGAPRADDVMFGAHAGIGAEWSFHSHWSVFIDGQIDVYAGHDRASGGWTGNVDEKLRPFWTAQLNLGVQLHFGAPR